MRWSSHANRSAAVPTNVVYQGGRPLRYQFGDASLRELEIELEDSEEKGYLISSRAIKIDWDTGKMTVLLTSLPLKVIDASEVVFSYFQNLGGVSTSMVMILHQVIHLQANIEENQ